MRIVDYWGHSPEIYAVATWASAVGFHVEATITKGAQAPNACGYIAAHACTMLRRAGPRWLTCSTTDACNPKQIKQGNELLNRKPKTTAAWLNGDEVLELVHRWLPGDRYGVGPLPLYLFMNNLGDHVRQALSDPPQTSPLTYAICNTSSVVPGHHWFVVAYCTGDPQAPVAHHPPVAAPAPAPAHHDLSDLDDEISICSADLDADDEAWMQM